MNIDDLGDGILHNSSVSPLNQHLITLRYRYYATGNLLSVNDGLFEVHKCAGSRIRKKISRAVASLDNNHIKFLGNRIECLCNKVACLVLWDR